MNSSQRIIAIAGAGISGMTAALGLEKAGFRVLLFEKAQTAANTGTGIQISPNAFNVLDELGLSRSIKTAGFAPDSIKIGVGKSGKELTEFKLGHTAHNRHDAPYIVLHRIDLIQILEAACRSREDIEIIRGHKVCDMVTHQKGVTVMSEVANSLREDVVSAVVGADGAWSTVRKFIPGASEPVFTGKIAWRALANIDQIPDKLDQQSTGLWLGPDAHLVHYPIRQGSLLNIIAITRWENETPPKPGWQNSSTKDERIKVFARWQPMLRDLVSLDLDWGGWPIFSVRRIGKLAHGPFCLIGDAAHAMVPYGAQGGAAGIEDALVLAKQCQKSPQNLAAAFTAYSDIRKSRLQKTLRLSRNNGLIYHLKPPFDLARNFTMRRAKQEHLQRRMDWLYGWKVE